MFSHQPPCNTADVCIDAGIVMSVRRCCWVTADHAVASRRPGARAWIFSLIGLATDAQLGRDRTDRGPTATDSPP